MVDSDTSQTTSESGVDAEALDATQNIIVRLSNQLDELKEKQKEFNNMVKSVFDNDDKLQEVEEKAKEAKQEITSKKKELNETSEVKELRVKVADVKEDIKMVEESLNTHLLNFYQMTGSTVVDQPDGTEREFKVTAKIKPKKKGD